MISYHIFIIIYIYILNHIIKYHLNNIYAQCRPPLGVGSSTNPTLDLWWLLFSSLSSSAQHFTTHKIHGNGILYVNLNIPSSLPCLPNASCKYTSPMDPIGDETKLPHIFLFWMHRLKSDCSCQHGVFLPQSHFPSASAENIMVPKSVTIGLRYPALHQAIPQLSGIVSAWSKSQWTKNKAKLLYTHAQMQNKGK